MLCSPLRLPSPQFSGNSSEETLQFHAPCVRNYVRWPARMKNEAHGKQNELGEVWKKEGEEGGGQEQARQHRRAGSRPSSERIKRCTLRERRERDAHKRSCCKRREGGKKLVFRRSGSVEREGAAFCRPF